MPPEIIDIIVRYGYPAIFCLVFLQEIGVPGFPNEIVLMYFGYLGHEGLLYFPAVFGLAVLADIIGTGLLYLLFYHFRPLLLRLKPGWLKLPYKKINRLKYKMRQQGQWRIFIGRLTPFLRGLTSVIAGILHTCPKQYVIMVILSAILWSGGFVTAGWLIAPYWNSLVCKINPSDKWIYSTPFLIILCVIIVYYLTRRPSSGIHSEQVKPYHETSL